MLCSALLRFAMQGLFGWWFGCFANSVANGVELSPEVLKSHRDFAPSSHTFARSPTTLDNEFVVH
jgi:hypothetical protein